MKIVTENPKQFLKMHEADAGYDIVALDGGTVEARSSFSIDTGLKIQLPPGHVGIIKARSGMSVNHGLDVGAGVVDCGYTGEIKVLLRNHSDVPYTWSAGDRVAQMLILELGCVAGVMRVDSLDESERGDNGFNSTGK